MQIRLSKTLAPTIMNRELLIDLSGIMDEETFHEYVSKKLNFPGYYGYNLNAFWDCITDEEQSSMPRCLIVEGLAALSNYLPELHNGFVECLHDYKKEFPERELVLRQESPSGKGIKFDEE